MSHHCFINTDLCIFGKYITIPSVLAVFEIGNVYLISIKTRFTPFLDRFGRENDI